MAKVVGIITARGGSKGIPEKNMVDVAGKPLLAYSFETAEACEGLDRIILSTNMGAAVDLASKYSRIEVPFIRPERLCTDSSSQVDVAEHMVFFLEQEQEFLADYVVLLQPTCPLRMAKEIDQAIKLVKDKDISSLIGVTPVSHHPADYLYHERKGRGEFRWVMRSPEWGRRQDFPEVYFNTGALYICSSEYLKKYQRFFDESSYLYEMSEETLFDLDSRFDLKVLNAFVAEEGWDPSHGAARP